MGGNLLFLAGKKAYGKIKKNGLSPDDIGVCVSASGAAKWLALYGLDKKVFGSWLNNRSTPVNFFGTSIGAWKFAAACQKDPDLAFDGLADAYINQRYGKGITADIVSETGKWILESYLPDEKINEILTHPHYRISFSAVRCINNTDRESALLQSVSLLKAAFLNLIKRENLGSCFERTFFMDKRDVPYYAAINEFPLNKVFLNRDNFKKALLASGSIPLVMKAVENIKGAPEGRYRDGGIIDYHPCFDFTGNQDKIVLYHHFYDTLTPGWFDKKIFWRRAGSKEMENILLISPSEKFVDSLPEKRIPDRKDFNRFEGKDDLRISIWEEAKEKSLILGEEFMEAVNSGNIGDMLVEV